MEIQPINNYILIKVDVEAREAKGGIMVPKTAGEKTEAFAIWGIVAEISDQIKKEDENDKYKVGDKVLIKKWEGQDVSLGGSKYILIEPVHIMAVVNDGKQNSA